MCINIYFHFASQEEEIVKLKEEIKLLQQSVKIDEDNEQVAKLRSDNVKLKHRLAVLKRVCTI